MHTSEPHLLHVRLPAAVEVHPLQLLLLAVRAQLFFFLVFLFLLLLRMFRLTILLLLFMRWGGDVRTVIPGRPVVIVVLLLG